MKTPTAWIVVLLTFAATALAGPPKIALPRSEALPAAQIPVAQTRITLHIFEAATVLTPGLARSAGLTGPIRRSEPGRRVAGAAWGTRILFKWFWDAGAVWRRPGRVWRADPKG